MSVHESELGFAFCICRIQRRTAVRNDRTRIFGTMPERGIIGSYKPVCLSTQCIPCKYGAGGFGQSIKPPLESIERCSCISLPGKPDVD